MKLFLLLFTPVFCLVSSNALSNTTDELIRIALENNPALKGAVHQSKAAESSYRKQSILPKNPVFSFSYSNIPVTEFPSLTEHAMSGISIGLSQYIASPFESSARKKLFKNRYMAKQEIIREAKNGLALQIRLTHAALIFIGTKKQILNKNKETLGTISKVAESLVAVNRMNATQLLKIRAEIYDLGISLKEVSGILEKEKQKLEKLCGIPLAEKLLHNTTDDEQLQTIDLEKSDNFTPKTHPLYKKYEMLLKATQAAYGMEKAKTVPGITIGLDYRIRQKITGKDAGEDFISLKASVPLPLYYPLKERHAIRAEKQKLLAAEKELQNISLQLSTAWKGELKNFILLSKSFSEYQNQILPMYFSVYQSQISILPAGSTTIIDVLDSYRLYLKASLRKARLRRDVTFSRAKLMYLLYRFPQHKVRKEYKK